MQAIINNFTATADYLLAINRSVNSAVDGVIHLQMTLKFKLELFRNTICQTN